MPFISVRIAALSLTALCLSSCGLGHELLGGGDNANIGLGQSASIPTIFGYAVADEPQAAVIARQILNAGGNAADAAAAEGFALSVTLPSRAGLGGGGACLVEMKDAKGNAQAPMVLLFPAGAPQNGGGARPAAAPAMARGLLALQARYGELPFASVIVPAERLAANSVVSSALAADLKVVNNALLVDAAAAAVFGANGQVLQAGATLSQPDLAATFEVLRTQSVQGFYAGNFARNFLAAADAAGAELTPQDLSSALPHFSEAPTARHGDLLVAKLPVEPSRSQTLPASTAFAALDKNGGIVACTVSMNNLFGNGRIAAGTGVLMAASPRDVPAPQLAAEIAYHPGSGNFRAATTGTGQIAAAQAAQTAMDDLLGKTNTPIADPGRANLISCPGSVPGGEASCTASTDPRGFGLAIGGR